jgi:hypothetical protein
MTFPLFLGILAGAITVTVTLTWLFSRGEDAHH